MCVAIRLVPLDVDDDRIRRVLKDKRATLDVDEESQCHDAFGDYENWMQKLRHEVVELGKRLEADRNQTHFPLVVIVEELEDIVAALRLVRHDCFPLDYVSTMLRELKIAYGLLVEAYFQIWSTRGHDNFNADSLAGSISALLLNWISDAARYVTSTEARRWLFCACVCTNQCASVDCCVDNRTSRTTTSGSASRPCVRSR